MLAMVLRSMEESIHASFVLSYQGNAATGGQVLQVLAAHRAVAEAVVAAQPARAAKAMKALLSNVERNLQGQSWRPTESK
jgi:DNA-binding FadR family transcriptional regulator